MKMSLTKVLTFDSAHQLKDLEGSKCQRFHGHTYKLEVTVTGEVKGRVPMIMDLSSLKEDVKHTVNLYFDHHNLNETLKMDNPTAEFMCLFLMDKLGGLFRAAYGVQLSKITLWETPTSCATLEI